MCSVKDFQNLFMQSFTMYASRLFAMLLNYIVNMGKPDGICLPTFDADKCLGLFLHPSVFSTKHSRSE